MSVASRLGPEKIGCRDFPTSDLIMLILFYFLPLHGVHPAIAMDKDLTIPEEHGRNLDYKDRL